VCCQLFFVYFLYYFLSSYFSFLVHCFFFYCGWPFLSIIMQMREPSSHVPVCENVVVLRYDS
jgi:hypothetical protein